MVKEHVAELELGMSAADFWRLRMATAFEEHLARGEKQLYSQLEFEEDVDGIGEVTVRRVSKLTFETNPVPKALRGFLKDPDFAIHTRASWYKVTRHFRTTPCFPAAARHCTPCIPLAHTLTTTLRATAGPLRCGTPLHVRGRAPGPDRSYSHPGTPRHTV